MKAVYGTLPPVERTVTLTMTESEANTLQQIAAMNVTIPRALESLGRSEVKDVLDHINYALLGIRRGVTD